MPLGNYSERVDSVLRQRAFLQGLSAFIKMKMTRENVVGKDAQTRPHASFLFARSRPDGRVDRRVKIRTVNGEGGHNAGNKSGGEKAGLQQAGSHSASARMPWGDTTARQVAEVPGATLDAH